MGPHPSPLLKIPRCTADAPPLQQTASPLPLVVWSHGLTGTGCEHGLLAATLALSGFVVALPHHSDGSSSLTDLGENKTKLRYIHPDYNNYDKEFRQKQAEYRASEVGEMRARARRKGREDGAAKRWFTCARTNQPHLSHRPGN